VDRAGNGRPLRKVPTPGNTGSGGNPTGESPSHGAETTQPDGTVKMLHRRFRRDLVKRPPPREQALTDGMRSFPDRRGERAVECCLKRNGAYYHDLAAPARNRRCVIRWNPPFNGKVGFQLTTCDKDAATNSASLGPPPNRS
jgi:hypothetical protein